MRVGESFNQPCAHFSKMTTGERTLSLRPGASELSPFILT